MIMETEKCAALLTVLQCGSLKAAADQLGYTVSGISRMMAALEEETGFPLLIRSHSGVAPTRECRQLLPTMEDLVRSAEHYRQLAADLRGLEVGSVQVGVCYNAYCRQLAQLIAGFSLAHPHIQIDVLDNQLSSAMIEALNHHRVDLCFISYRKNAPNWLRLQRVQLMAILPRASPLAQAGSFPIQRLDHDPYIQLFPDRETDTSRMLSRLGLRPNVRFTCSSVSSAFAMVEAGLGIAVVSDLELLPMAPGVAAVPLDPPQFVDIGLALPPPEETSPAVRRFIAYIRENFVPEPCA